MFTRAGSEAAALDSNRTERTKDAASPEPVTTDREYGLRARVPRTRPGLTPQRRMTR